MTLLAHSMGNYMMGFGVAAWVKTPREQKTLFNDVVLAAADEYTTTFAAPDAGRLSDLWTMTDRLTVYSSREDVLMLASHIANGAWRLGYDGPPNRASTAFFPTDHYSFVDCTANRDFTESFLAAPDRTHQYYRQSLSARADVARVLKAVAPTPAQRVYDADRNVWTVPV
jgi:esterase/lipase superfamily enzyme